MYEAMREPLLICGVPRDDYMRRYYIACEKLRRFEGDSLELIADDGEHDSVVHCCGGWTNYDAMTFRDANILLAMERAVETWVTNYQLLDVPEARLGDFDGI
jgi:hypothetical protein